MRVNQKTNEAFVAARKKKDLLVASHRGSSRAGIVENSIESFDIAILHGADIVEMDVAMSTDKELFVIHDTREPILLRTNRNVKTMTSAEIRSFFYYDLNGKTKHKINTFEEVLEHLKGRCFINLDRCWVCWKEVFRMVKRHNMVNQIIFKSPANKLEYIKLLEEQDTPFMYMPMLIDADDLPAIEVANVNMVAVEIMAKNDSHPVILLEYIRSLHKKGYILWVSAMSFGDQFIVSAGHDDNSSLLGNPDAGWGWLIDRGFDIIQTDWLLAFTQYLHSKKYNIEINV